MIVNRPWVDTTTQEQSIHHFHILKAHYVFDLEWPDYDGYSKVTNSYICKLVQARHMVIKFILICNMVP